MKHLPRRLATIILALMVAISVTGGTAPRHSADSCAGCHHHLEPGSSQDNQN